MVFDAEWSGSLKRTESLCVKPSRLLRKVAIFDSTERLLRASLKSSIDDTVIIIT